VKKEDVILACVVSLSIGLLCGYFICKSNTEPKKQDFPEVITEIPQYIPEIIDKVPKEEKQETEKVESLGNFTLTAYCSCSKCCGKNDGITATGVKAKQGETIAVDTKVIPYGSKVKIKGNTYIAQDTMARWVKEKYDGKIIDIYFNDHCEALDFGVQESEVFIVSK